MKNMAEIGSSAISSQRLTVPAVRSIS